MLTLFRDEDIFTAASKQNWPYSLLLSLAYGCSRIAGTSYRWEMSPVVAVTVNRRLS
jgi:hypothetical protein